jgi:hypothetical protein
MYYYAMILVPKAWVLSSTKIRKDVKAELCSDIAHLIMNRPLSAPHLISAES